MVTPTSLRFDLEFMLKDIEKLIELDKNIFEKSAQGELFEIQGLIERALDTSANIERIWGLGKE